MYVHATGHTVLSDETAERLIGDQDPIYVVHIETETAGVIPKQYYTTGSEVVVEHVDSDNHYVAIVNVIGTGMNGVERDLEKFVEGERVNGKGDDLALTPADGYDPVGPVPCEIEREDV